MPTAGTPLTDKEAELVSLVAQGMTNNEIAVRLWLTPDTIRSHLARISRRLGARNRVHVVVRAMETGRWWPDGTDTDRDVTMADRLQEARRLQRAAEDRCDGYRRKYLTSLETAQELRETIRELREGEKR
jgi:DNA-binding CsgD family transcriptional regulator